MVMTMINCNDDDYVDFVDDLGGQRVQVTDVSGNDYSINASIYCINQFLQLFYIISIKLGRKIILSKLTYFIYLF